ncbi:S-formylglutathione hydrolase FrmB [Mycolicibacterium fluoranthenivorans]|uniref:S-formylglutathione hydrolase FrmB n=1 Tax=Mycolicibacterium fluoranthenivorans TaxID=258505 RepID=A0A7X5U6L0_9MYCO|nr:S-formylglutathione hydrolase FrmB [Mycolicibacterium fluoranthenivorans]
MTSMRWDMRLGERSDGKLIRGERSDGKSLLQSAIRKTVQATCAALLALGLWSTAGAPAHADGIEYLQVPSAAMGRDIPVAFQAGGPHAVYLLDAFNAAPEVSNWVNAGAFNTLAGKGISVAAPAGGAFSMYTNWEQDGSKQWETFLSQELPDWLAANKGLAPTGHGVVGAAQGGTAALTLAEFHPDRFRYAGSMSGFLTVGNTFLNGAITAGMAQFGGVNTQDMWGPAQFGRWKWHDPDAHVQLLADNNTRIWVFSPQTLTCSDPAAMIGYCDQAQGSNRAFYSHYRSLGGRNGHFDFPTGGQHDWSSWGPQLAALSGDLSAAIR